MPNRVFVDTHYVIALINRRDKHHKLAQELASRYEGRPLLTTEAILLEIGDALARQFKQQAIITIDQFLDSDDTEIVSLTPALRQKAFELYKAYDDKSWGMTDCVSFVVMREEDVTEALTSDQHFVQAGFTALMNV